ncbi:TPA: exosortase/archaeosortase family protein [Candidatus Bathyarchaeota archaeon]|nr:exosortase/archaeosortase family protein [Candidatus Bathyarchaeota archaeon]
MIGSVSAEIKEKPVFKDALIMGSLSLTIGFFLVYKCSCSFIAFAVYSIISASGITAIYDEIHQTISIVLPDGTPVSFEVLSQCSGIVTIGIFAVISTFTIGLIKGRVHIKIAWFIVSLIVGFLWNINRLAIALLVAYNFGINAFSIIHFLFAPTVDFVWVVSMWALGMSLVKSGGDEKK